jgi:hypothetical protein
MGGPTRRRIFGDRVGGAKIRAVHVRERAREATGDADAAECLLWSERMEGFGGPAQPAPTIVQCLFLRGDPRARSLAGGWVERVLVGGPPTRQPLHLRITLEHGRQRDLQDPAYFEQA